MQQSHYIAWRTLKLWPGKATGNNDDKDVISYCHTEVFVTDKGICSMLAKSSLFALAPLVLPFRNLCQS